MLVITDVWTPAESFLTSQTSHLLQARRHHAVLISSQELHMRTQTHTESDATSNWTILSVIAVTLPFIHD